MSSFTVDDALDREALNNVRVKLAAFNVAIAEARARRFEFVIGCEPVPGQDAFISYSNKVDVSSDLRTVATKRHAIAAPAPKHNETSDAAKN